MEGELRFADPRRHLAHAELQRAAGELVVADARPIRKLNFDEASELAYYPEDPEAEAGRAALAAELAILRKETAGKMYG